MTEQAGQVERIPDPVPEDKDRGLRGTEMLALVVLLVVWVATLMAGILVNSAPYRDRLLSPHLLNFQELLLNALIVLATYTMSNVAILAFVAGILGCLAARAELVIGGQPGTLRDRVNPKSSAILRSFLVYVALMSGVLILVEAPFATPTQEKYVRLAGLVSLLSFWVNWKPAFFGGIADGVSAALKSRADTSLKAKGTHR
jgi:hypothetical protein